LFTANAVDYRKDGYMKLMTDTGLRQIRTGLGISQEGIARRTRSVSTGTVKNAESGKRVTFDTATQILEAINKLLEEAGREKITLDDLGLTLY
jgi:DNA-binding transcriptional regulator YiaG